MLGLRDHRNQLGRTPSKPIDTSPQLHSLLGQFETMRRYGYRSIEQLVGRHNSSLQIPHRHRQGRRNLNPAQPPQGLPHSKRTLRVNVYRRYRHYVQTCVLGSQGIRETRFDRNSRPLFSLRQHQSYRLLITPSNRPNILTKHPSQRGSDTRCPGVTALVSPPVRQPVHVVALLRRRDNPGRNSRHNTSVTVYPGISKPRALMDAPTGATALLAPSLPRPSLPTKGRQASWSSLTGTLSLAQDPCLIPSAASLHGRAGRSCGDGGDPPPRCRRQRPPTPPE